MHRSHLYSPCSYLLVLVQGKVFSSWVYSYIHLDILVHVVSLFPGVILIVTTQAICYLTVFAFDLGDIKIELGHIVHPPHLSP